MDPDPVRPERLDPDPDPVNIRPDPKPWGQGRKLTKMAILTFYLFRMFAEFGFHIPYQYVIMCIPLGKCGIRLSLGQKERINAFFMA